MKKPDVCSVRGCQKPRWAQGWCGMHYRRWQRTGSLVNPDDPAERFARALAPPDENGCRVWLLSCGRGGYGKFRDGDGRTVPAHRWAYEHFVGRIPKRKPFVCHRCDNPACCEPTHLFVGTQAANLADMRQKGRQRYPGRPPKLSEKDVVRIRKLAAAGKTQVSLAAQFGVDSSHISLIVRGKRR